jgi:hypothetical protein
MIRRPFVPVALVVVALVATGAEASAEESEEFPNAVQLPEEPLRQTPLRTEGTGHLALGHSDLSLELGEYFAAAGVQLAATTLVLAVGASVALAVAYIDRMNERRFHEIVTVMALASPLVSSLPSSLVAFKMSQRCLRRDHRWGYTLLAGMVTSAASAWGAALLATGAFSSSPGRLEATVVVLVAGVLLPPAAEVLTLHFTSTEVVAAPLLLKDGAGVALGLRF